MFWQVIFWALLVPVLIILGIVYGTSKRLYKLFYILSTFTYVITVAYLIDVFDLGRNWILGLLVLSAVIMILLGYRLTRRGEAKPRKARPTRRPLAWVLSILGVMLVLIVVSAINIGASRDDSQFASSIPLDALLLEDGKGYPPRFVNVGNITYSNTFIIPAVMQDKHFLACWYDEQEGIVSSYEELQVQSDGEFGYTGELEPLDEVFMGETRTRRIGVGQSVYLPYDEKGVLAESARSDALARYRDYEAIIVVASPERIGGCSEVEEKQRKGDLSLYKRIALE